jgi:isopenicillin N synthase-like dioxygenase
MQTEITLENILKNDDNVLRKVRLLLKKRGWCFVKFSSSLQSNIKNVHEKLKYFFSEDSKIKKKYSYTYNIGYYDSSFKQHLKILTGNYNTPNLESRNTDSINEKNMKNSTSQLSKTMDNIMKKLTLSSLFNLTNEQTKYLSTFSSDNAGLLDIVSYKPNIDISRTPYYVSEHVDPGLFSLNFFSNASGMQFYDSETKKWYELSHGYGVIFCGQAAKKLCNFTPALHRVLNNGMGRFSMWYEVGIKSQLQPKKDIKKIVSLPENKAISPMMKVTAKVNSERKVVFVPKDGTLFDLKKAIEDNNGPPTSKIIQPSEVTQKIELKNGDNKKIGNITNWKLTNSGYLVPDDSTDDLNMSSSSISYAPFNRTPLGYHSSPEDPYYRSYVPPEQRPKYVDQLRPSIKPPTRYQSASNYYMNSFR